MSARDVLTGLIPYLFAVIRLQFVILRCRAKRHNGNRCRVFDRDSAERSVAGPGGI